MFIERTSPLAGGRLSGLPCRIPVRAPVRRSPLLFLVLALPLLVACGRVKSCVRHVVRGDDDDDEPKAPAVQTGPAAETPIGEHPRIWLDPPTLDVLRQRMTAGTPAWKALDEKCASLMLGPVEYPDGKDYPEQGIGEGYQGSDYFDALLEIALCHQTLKGKDDARAKALAARGADVLEKMSEPEGPHSVNPLRDDGFGIRFFVTTMAIGYDWLYPELTPALRERVRAALTKWIETFDAKGFGRNHAQGNYFAGYYSAKALAALATQGDFDKSPIWWNDWLERLHRQMVQPYYAKHMVGGGWPEGWNYGALATLNMTWPVWAAKTAKGMDLFRDTRASYTFPFDQGLHLVQFSWPDRIHIDDRGTNYDGEFDEVSVLPTSTLTVLPALLRAERDPFADRLQRFAREVREKRAKKKPAPWMEFLYWDPSAKEADYTNLPRSFVAWGMHTVAMRSSWDESATWASFTAGTYVGSPDSGEMHFDQGSLAVVRGNRPLLVNAATALKRRATGEPEPKDDPIYEDLFGNHDKESTKANRTIFNIFYARTAPLPGMPETSERYGQISAMPGKAQTKLARYEDQNAWVFLRGERLEDMYRRGPKNEPRVTTFTRQVLYVRPSLFVVDDRTEVASGDLDQWMAWNLAFPAAARPDESGVLAFDAGPATAFAGTMAVVLPRGATVKTSDLFGRHKVAHVEVRPPTTAKEKTQRWLTVLDAGAAAPLATKVRALDGAPGALVESADGVVAVATLDGGAGEYRAPAGATHYLTGLDPQKEVKVTAATAGTTVTVTVARGSGIRASQGGVVAFRIDGAGVVGPLNR